MEINSQYQQLLVQNSVEGAECWLGDFSRQRAVALAVPMDSEAICQCMHAVEGEI